MTTHNSLWLLQKLCVSSTHSTVTLHKLTACVLGGLQTVVLRLLEVRRIVFLASEIIYSSSNLSQVIVQFFLSEATMCWVSCNNQISWRWRLSCSLVRTRSSRSYRSTRRISAFSGCTYRLIRIYVIYLCPVNAFINDVGFPNRLEWLCSLDLMTSLSVRSGIRIAWRLWPYR